MSPLPAPTPSLPPVAAPILTALERLVAVVAQLRHPEGGCPWDLQQTPQSLIPYVLEEAYEVVEALEGGDGGAIAEELGDLLLQVVLQAQVAHDQGQFDLGTVAQGIADKLIRRHPHVFGSVTVAGVEEVHRNWEAIKDQEAGRSPQGGITPKLRKDSRTLPPLMAASRISQRAAAVGFEWDSVAGVWEKFEEELGEFRAAIASEPPENQAAELGDLLFTLVNLARWYGIDPSLALQGTNRRFIDRFEQVEAAAGGNLADLPVATLEALWQQAKQHLGHRQPPPDPPQGSGAMPV